jgi:hypothetical protein
MEQTAQQIAKHYSACMDSVNLINAGKQERFTDEEWTNILARNKEYLQQMLAQDFWTTEDLEPLRLAANA